MKSLFRFYVIVYILLFAYSSLARQFKVASWNILSQEPYEKYAFAEKPIKAPTGFIWEVDSRVNAIAKQLTELINKHQVDVICLQEVNLSRNDEYEPLRAVIENAGYAQCIFEKNDRKQRDSQTTAVIYNPKVFEPSKSACISHYNQVGGKGYSSAHLVFTGNVSGPELTFVSVHLPFRGKNSTQQLESLTAILKDSLIAPKGKITILCGDFNWTSTAYFYHYQNNAIVNDDRLKSYFPKTYELLKTTLKNAYAGEWNDAARSVSKYSNPTAMQGWGTLETIDYIWYAKQPNIDVSCVGFEQIPKFDVTNVDDYFDQLVKHGYPIPHQELINAAQKNSTTLRSDFFNVMKKSLLKKLNSNPPVTFTPFRDFPSDHVILIATFDIQLPESDALSDFAHALSSF